MPTKRKKMNAGEPMRKRSKIDLEMKLNIINKYEEGESIASIRRDHGLASSTVSTIIKDAIRIKEHVAQGSVSLKSTIITKKRSLAITEMEKLLTVWMQAQIQDNVELNLKTIKTKATYIFEEMKSKYPEGCQSFVASNGWFARYKRRAGLNIQITEDATENVDANIEEDPVQVKLEIEENDMEESMDSNDEESFKWGALDNEETIKSESPEYVPVSEISEVVHKPRDFVTEEMLLAFREISAGLARLEKALFTVTMRQTS